MLGQSAWVLTLIPLLQGAFFPLSQGNWSLLNQAVEPHLQEEERMVYVAFSEFFFDSALESYFRAGALQLSLVGDKVMLEPVCGMAKRGLVMELLMTLAHSHLPSQVPRDLDMLLRASYFGSIVLVSDTGGRDVARVGGHTTCRGTVRCAGGGPPVVATE